MDNTTTIRRPRGRPVKAETDRRMRLEIFMEPHLLEYVQREAAANLNDRGDIEPITPSTWVRNLVNMAEINSRIV